MRPRRQAGSGDGTAARDRPLHRRRPRIRAAAVGVALAAVTAVTAGGAGFVLGSAAHDAGGHGDRHGFAQERSVPDGLGANAFNPDGPGTDAG